MLEIYVAVPLAVAAVVSLLMRGRSTKYVRYVAFGASILSLLLTLVFVLGSPVQLQQLGWFSFLGYSFTLTFSAMPLNIILLLIVGIVTPLIMAYSIGFMDLPSDQSRYYSEMCIFAVAMMIFAMAGDFITMFIGWELLGITSYLLIGFWYQKVGTPEAARKAITTILIGDVLMLASMLIIWSSYHTFVFAQLIGSQSHSWQMELSLILIMFAVFTKSAQFPFHEWLADAMKGPTPVSAFLHSSTMVKAGVFLVAVLLPLFIAYHLLYLLVIFGLITAFIGATNALSSNHIKRILAYSTIEDLGLMFVALGTGSLLAAMMFFIVQTFYKALLFMSAGSIMKANDYEEDIKKVYNSASYKQIFIPTIIGVASLAGLYPLSGFFGKAALYASASIPIYALLLVVEILSSTYIFRWLFIPLKSKSDSKTVEARANYKTMPRSMVLPMDVLAVLAAITGPVLYMYVPAYLGAYGATQFKIGLLDIAASVIIVVIGILAAFYLFYKGKYKMSDGSSIHAALHNSVFVNLFYEKTARFIEIAADVLESIDHSIYDVIKGGGRNVTELGSLLKRMETGNVNAYIAAFIIGMLVILALFLL
ncbi:MAG: NADH-quinone oxidoreductase subunit 5 family protein [Candidatus Micrarchaeaceae archaeon]